MALQLRTPLKAWEVCSSGVVVGMAVASHVVACKPRLHHPKTPRGAMDLLSLMSPFTVMAEQASSGTPSSLELRSEPPQTQLPVTTARDGREGKAVKLQELQQQRWLLEGGPS